MKLSTGKASFPGLKQVFRHEGPDGRACGDTLGLQARGLRDAAVRMRHARRASV